MLEAQGVTIRYGDRAAVRDIDFVVAPGERVALFGLNGSGKSTLLKCLCAQVWPETGCVTLDGMLLRAGEDLERLRLCVGMVGQDPDNQMVASTLFDEIAFGPCNLGLGSDAVCMRVEDAIRRCGLEGFERRQIGSLSGGQRQRAAIAGVLAMQPAYLLCDEPCSMLDLASRCSVMEILNDAAQEGCGVVVITHELSDVLSFDRAVVLEGGRKVWEGTPIELLMDECACKRAGCNVSMGLQEMVRKVRAGTMKPVEVQAQSLAHLLRGGLEEAVGRIAKVRGSRLEGLSRNDRCGFAEGMREPKGLRLHDASFAYRDRLDACKTEPSCDAVHAVTCGCKPSSVCAIIGPTGSGKTTAAKIISGLIEPDHGTAKIDGRTVEAGEVGYVFQRTEDQLFAATVEDDVAFGPRNRGLRKHEAYEKARRALKRMGLDVRAYATANPFALSGGQMRRVAVAGVLAMETEYVVFDEPTVGLDAHGIRALGDLIAELKNEGVGVMLVTHDVERAVVWSDYVVVLAGGAVVWEGVPAGLADCMDVLERAGLLPDCDGRQR